MKKFVYFVSFSYFNDFGWGYGNAPFELEQPITTLGTIRDIVEDKLAIKGRFKRAIISNFQLLREEEEED